jgi:hypothetical protein
MKQWALVGARARIAELTAEIDRIRATFPGEFGGRGRAAQGGAPRTGKRRLSAAGRKAISDAAKLRWAKVRAERQGGAKKK